MPPFQDSLTPSEYDWMYGNTLSNEELSYWSNPEVRQRFEVLRQQVGPQQAYEMLERERQDMASNPLAQHLRQGERY